MKRLVYAVLFFALVFAAARFGQQIYPLGYGDAAAIRGEKYLSLGDYVAVYIVLVLGYVSAMAILPAIRRWRARREGLPVRSHVFLSAILLVALPLIISLLLFFDAMRMELPTAPVVQFLIGTKASELYWAFLLSYLLVALVILAPIFSLSVFSANWLMSQYPGFTRFAAARYLFDVQLGIHKAAYLVSHNEIRTLRHSAGAPSELGGPGILITEEGHAVITMRGGRVERIVGTGITFLRPFERPHQVVYLVGRAEKLPVSNVVTRDHIVISQIELSVFHRLDRGDESHQNGRLPFDERIIRERIWSPRGGDWRDSIKGVADGALRDVVARHPLEEVVSVGSVARQSLKREMVEAMNSVASILGVVVLSVDFGAVDLPKEAREGLLERGLSEVKRRTAIVNAEAAHDEIVTLADAERYKTITAADAERQKTLTAADAERAAALLKAESERALRVSQAEALKQTKITVSEGESQAKLNMAEADRIGRLLRGEADKQVILWKGEAKADWLAREEYARAQGAAERIRQIISAFPQAQLEPRQAQTLIITVLRENEARRARSLAMLENQVLLTENENDLHSALLDKRTSADAPELPELSQPPQPPENA